MRNRYLDPAHTIIERLGGLDKAMAASGASKPWVSRWRLPKDRRGTGGLIPVKYQQPILDWARKHRIALTPDDFFVARKGRRSVRPKSSVPRKAPDASEAKVAA